MQDFFRGTDYFSVNRVFIYPRTLRKAGVCPFGDGFRHKKSTCCRKCLKRTFIVRRRLFSAVFPFFRLACCRVYGFSAKVTTESRQNREEFCLLFPNLTGKQLIYMTIKDIGKHRQKRDIGSGFCRFPFRNRLTAHR